MFFQEAVFQNVQVRGVVGIAGGRASVDERDKLIRRARAGRAIEFVARRVGV